MAAGSWSGSLLVGGVGGSVVVAVVPLAWWGWPFVWWEVSGSQGLRWVGGRIGGVAIFLREVVVLVAWSQAVPVRRVCYILEGSERAACGLRYDTMLRST